MGLIKEKILQLAKQFEGKKKLLLLQAFEFAKEAHKGQKRKSTNIPFVLHPVTVAEVLWEKYQDYHLMLAAILHDTVEDADDVTIENIHDTFGDNICFLVDAVSKNTQNFHHYEGVFFDEKIERLLWGGMKDIRVLLLKIADRQHNLETLHQLKDAKQVRMAFETQAIYEPLKQILKYDENNSFSKTQQIFNDFLQTNNIEDAKTLKHYLYNCTFVNLSDQSFDFIYRHSTEIIWKVNDIETYRLLRNSPIYNKKIDFLTVRGGVSSFEATFRFIKGAIATNPDFNLEIAAFKT